MIIHSLNVGAVATHAYEGRNVATGFFKYPVTGTLHLSASGFAGEQQADLVHHGGPEKAVLLYAAEHYPHWEAFLGRAPGPAVLGENLTVTGMTEEQVHIGDTYQVGTAVVQVCQPRVPCFKANLRHGHPGILAEVVRTGYSGYYVRVLTEGQVSTGDSLTLLNRPAGAPTVAWANYIFHHDRKNRAGVLRLLETEGLAAVWRGVAQKWLDQPPTVAD